MNKLKRLSVPKNCSDLSPFEQIVLVISKSLQILGLLPRISKKISRNKFKKHSVTKNCSDLSLFEQIVLVISKIWQILSLQPQISKVFYQSIEQFFLTVGQNNFGNKIPFLSSKFIFMSSNDLWMFSQSFLYTAF